MSMSAALLTCRNILHKVPRTCGSGLSTPLWPSGCHHLFTPAALGLDNFTEVRERTAFQFTNMSDKFKTRMEEIIASKGKSMIFTEDLKNVVHLAEAKDEDLLLVLEMTKKFNQQHQGLRFGAFVFGPVVMRMYHHLNQPGAALQALQTKELDGFFDQMVSFQLAMDLLYKNERYQDVLDVFDLLQDKRIGGVRYPKNSFTIAVAACFKMNTQESLTQVMKLLESAEEYGLVVNRRHIVFIAALALKQNHPHIALEMLSKANSVTHIAIRSVKVMALCELGRVEDTLPLLRSLIQIDLPSTSIKGRVSCIISEAVKCVEAALKETGQKEQVAEFENIVRSLQETNIISDKTLDMILSEHIDAFKKHENTRQDKAMLAASFHGKYQGRGQTRSRPHRRQGLADME